MQEAPTQSLPRLDSWCPVCGAAAERGALVCLECGSRITLAYRRPPSWKVPVAIGFTVLIFASLIGVLAYRAIDDEAEREVASAPAQVADRAAGGGDGDGGGQGAEPQLGGGEASRGDDANAGDPATGDEPGAGAKGADEDEPPPGDDEASRAETEEAGDLVKQGPVYTWPRSLRGFTVVLLSNEDRASATAFARSAAESGGAQIGVIRSNDFASLPQGFFVVFAGSYPDRAAADKAAARLGRRFKGAFPQLVRR